jgi:hypothetical protein
MPKALTIQAKLEVEIPRPPNFLRLVGSGVTGEVSIDVADLEVADLHAAIKAWGDLLIENYLQRRRDRLLVKAAK